MQHRPAGLHWIAHLLAPGPDHLTLLKPRYSAFFATPLNMLLREMGGEKSAAYRHGDRHVRAFFGRGCLHAQPPPARARQSRGGGNTGHAMCRPGTPGTHPALLHPQFTWAQPLHRGLARVAFQRPPACFFLRMRKSLFAIEKGAIRASRACAGSGFCHENGFFGLQTAVVCAA